MKNITYINAGAGSGKTFTLTRILSESLSGNDSKGNVIPTVEPSQVILTTFTELAASEFREKARQKVLETGNFDAAAQIDSAAIGTVHSVALRFIKKFWYLLDYGAEIQTISERDEQFYMSQSLSRIVSERDQNGVLKKEAELEAFREFRSHFNICNEFGHPDYLFWQQHLKDVVEKMEYYDVNDVGDSIDKSLDTIKKIFNVKYIDGIESEEEKKKIYNYLQKYYEYIKEATTKTAADQRTAIVPLLTCKNIYRLTSLIGSLKDPVGGAKSIESKCPGYGEFMESLNKLSVSAFNVKVMEPYVKGIFSLAKEWRNDYVAYKKENHIISYNDMERLFLHLITQEKEVQDYIRDNYRLIMVDEFQDSNPIQLKIFNQLSELIAPNGHSFWVGDPKQAIYGFRGADTDLVNSVSKHFKFYDDADIHPEEGENKLGSGRLVESWRSRRSLVELVNHVFADKFDEEIDPLCIKLEPHFKDDNLTSSPILHWHNPKKGNQTKVKADALAWKVKGLLASDLHVHEGKQDSTPSKIRPKDVAVLCRKNDTIKDIVKAMRKIGVPVSESEDAIMQRIEVQLLVTLLQFIQTPSNKHVIADLMRLLWGNTTEEILHDRISYVLEEDDNKHLKHFDENGKLVDDHWMEDSKEILKLRELRDRFQHMSIPEMVNGLIYECNLPSIVERWGDAHTRRQNLSTVQHLAEDYDQMCLQMGLGTSISGFVYYLNSIEPDKEKDNLSDTVKVFSYHGSKGLEWPVVILNELNGDSLASSDLIKKAFMRVREMEKIGEDKSSEQDPFAKEYYLHFFPNIIQGSSKPLDPMADAIEALDSYKELEEKTRSEEKRLLYVGMTRAKDYLISTGINDEFKWLRNIGLKKNCKEDIWCVGDKGNPCEEISSPGEDISQKGNASYSIVKKPDIHDTYGPKYLSPSKIESFEGYSNHSEWKEKGTSIDTKGWGDDYAATGSCIHDIYAVYQKGANDANQKAASNIITGYGVADKLSGHIDAIIGSADWLYETLQSKFPQADGDKVERELPFIMTLSDGRILRGEIDMLWHYTNSNGEKGCVIVDYKTFHGVKLEEHTKTHYAQLSAYVAALKDAGIQVSNALIYYPVYATIHELK